MTKKNTTPLKQFQNHISKLQKEEQFIPLAHKCMTAHFHDLIQALP